MGMARIETGSLEEIVHLPKGKGFIKAIGGPQFLAAQIFTILATILGVYLAGYVSFQRTLEYDRYQKAQQRSDLLTATREELKQNIALLQKFNGVLAADENLASATVPDLRLFVWQAAGRSSSAFDVPPQLLTDLQSLYGDVGKKLAKAQADQYFLTYIGRAPQDRKEFNVWLRSLLNLAETSILPALDKAIGASEQLVRKYAAADDVSR
jgi:hypothetical protein